MIELGSVIYEENIKGKPTKFRRTVRAVILNQTNQVLMLYSKKFNDYTFPGGGVKNKEDDIKALKRELKEEMGATRIRIKKPLGYIKEIKYGLYTNEFIYEQTSVYYFCKIDDVGFQKLESREIIDEIKPVFIHLDEAISHNELVKKDQNHQAYGLKTVLERENTILKTIKEYIHEKI